MLQARVHTVTRMGPNYGQLCPGSLLMASHTKHVMVLALALLTAIVNVEVPGNFVYNAFHR